MIGEITATTTMAGPRFSISLLTAIAYMRLGPESPSGRRLLNATETDSSSFEEAKIRQLRRQKGMKHISMRPVRQLSLILLAHLICTIMSVVRSKDGKVVQR